MSATSSRKSVPPSARATNPSRSETAPVNAPLTCPNTSLQNSSSGSAAMLTGTNGRAARDECWCSDLATLSFPVPVSP